MSVYKRRVKSSKGKITEYWYVEVHKPDGGTIKRSMGKAGQVTKAVARQYEADLKKKIRLGQLDMVKAEIPTLNDIKGEYIKYVRDVKQKRSWQRDEELLRPLCKLLGNKRLSDISTKDLEEFKLVRLKEVSPATVNRSLSVLRHLFNLAKRWNKFYGDNPISIVGLLEEHNKVERILTLRSRIKKIDEAMRTRLIARGFDAWDVISELMRVKRVIQTKAAQKDDWALVWRTEMDTVDKLISLGLIKAYDPLSASQDDDFGDIDAKTLRKEYEEAKTKEKNKSPGAKAKIKA
jgi:hypothetical protein